MKDKNEFMHILTHTLWIEFGAFQLCINEKILTQLSGTPVVELQGQRSHPCYFAVHLALVGPAPSLYPLSVFHSNHCCYVLWDFWKPNCTNWMSYYKIKTSLPSWRASCCVHGVSYPAWWNTKSSFIPKAADPKLLVNENNVCILLLKINVRKICINWYSAIYNSHKNND